MLYQKVKIHIYMHHLCDYYYYFAYTDYHVNNHNNYYPTICLNYYGFLHLVLYTLEFGQARNFVDLDFQKKVLKQVTVFFVNFTGFWKNISSFIFLHINSETCLKFIVISFFLVFVF